MRDPRVSGGPDESARKVRIADLSIGRDAELVGPIMALLNNVASLHHAVRMYPTALGLGHLDYAGLQDFLARVTDGSAQVARRLRLAIGSLDVLHGAVTYTEGLLLLEHCVLTIEDDVLRHDVETPQRNLNLYRNGNDLLDLLKIESRTQVEAG